MNGHLGYDERRGRVVYVPPPRREGLTIRLSLEHIDLSWFAFCGLAMVLADWGLTADQVEYRDHHVHAGYVETVFEVTR